jgi:hypothetical protein
MAAHIKWNFTPVIGFLPAPAHRSIHGSGGKQEVRTQQQDRLARPGSLGKVAIHPPQTGQTRRHRFDVFAGNVFHRLHAINAHRELFGAVPDHHDDFTPGFLQDLTGLLK